MSGALSSLDSLGPSERTLNPKVPTASSSDLAVRPQMLTVPDLKRGGGLKEVLFVALDTREFKPLQARIQGGA